MFTALCNLIYHSGCLMCVYFFFQHDTCPICRKSLGDEGIEDHHPGSGGNNMSNVGPSLAAFFRY
jgi:hypothetical protein